MWLRKQTHQQQRPPPATAASSNIPSANPDRMDPHRTITRKATAVAQPYVEEEEEEEEEEEDEEDDVVEVYDSEESSEAGTESLTWISWFCSRAGNDYFAEVAEEYVEDDFNLTGLSNLVPFYKEALELILDMEPEDDQSPDIPDPAVVETSAELLYGLIHQRFILTRQGLLQMMEKYEAGHFGFCPRVYCERARVLPVGISDLQGVDTVKLYCPSCYDLYTPAFSRYHDIDGAYFGTTFPHLLFEQVPEAASAAREQPLNIYVPRIFGFRVSERSRSGPRMQWLRWRPEDGQVEEETGDTE